MIEATRTAMIWGIDLSVFYFYSRESLFAERWLPFSWLQLCGFVFLFIGQCVYSQVITVPGLFYPDDEPSALPEWESPASMQSLHSPVGRSPQPMSYKSPDMRPSATSQ